MFELSPEINSIEKGSVWCFIADRAFDAQEAAYISNSLELFIGSWTSHERKMMATFQLLDNQALLVVQNAAAADVSGCGKDKLIQHMTQLGNEMQIDFFCRDVVCVQAATQTELIFCRLEALEENIQKGEIAFSDLLLNTSIGTVAQLKSDLWIPLDQSWVARYISIDLGQV